MPVPDASHLSLKQRIDRGIAARLPAWVQDEDADMQRRARLVLAFAFVIFFCGPIYGTLYLALGMYASATGAGAVMVMLAGTPWLVRRLRSVQAGAHWVTLSCYVALALVTCRTGGIAAPAVAWLALLPVTALMLCGTRGGLLWTAVSLATVVAYLILELSGLTPTSEVPPTWIALLRFLVGVGLVGLIALLAWMYESQKDQMLGALQSKNCELEQARDGAREAHRDARLVLDHVGDGLLLVDRAGKAHGERSNAVERLFGRVLPGTSLWELLDNHDPSCANRLRCAWEQVFDDFLPLELAIDQLPTRCHSQSQTLELCYVPVVERDRVQRVLVVFRDITPELRAEELQRRQQEQLDVFRWVVQDRRYFSAFLDEAERMVVALASGSGSDADRARWLHTLKGNAGLFGLHTFARACHELETRLLGTGEYNVTPDVGAEIARHWDAVSTLVGPLLGAADSADAIVLQRLEYDQFVDAVQSRRSHEDLYREVVQWAWVPSATHLNRLAEQATALAARNGKGHAQVRVVDCGIRLPPTPWTELWITLAHVVRNAIDHGLEPEQERLVSGKSPQASLNLGLYRDSLGLTLEVVDDGRGIDWEGVRQKAIALGLPSSEAADLEAALFAEGVSTKESASELSGRGVGLTAVLHACRALGGTIRIRSESNAGTTLRLHFPWDRVTSTFPSDDVRAA